MSNCDENLYKALSRVCRGRTGVAGAMAPWIQKRNKRKRVQMEIFDTQPEEKYDTVLLIDYDTLPDKAAFGLFLADARKRLNGHGRLIVCVKNRDYSEDRFAFSRRELKYLLRPMGTPKLLTSQPFKWLAMYLDCEFYFPKSVEQRHRVFANLCCGTVLELGSGKGHLSAEISNRRLRVTGVELNREKSILSKVLYPDVHFIQGNILSLPEEVVPHDTVLLPEVIEHVDQETGQNMLRIAWELVIPGGRLIVSVPNEDLVPHRNHVTTFSFASLEKLLSRFGSPIGHYDQPFKWLLMHVDKHL